MIRKLKFGLPEEVSSALWEVDRLFHARMVRAIGSMVPNEAEDVWNGVLEKLPGKIQIFRDREDGSFAGWLHKCVVNSARDAWRLQEGRHELLVGEPDPPQNDDTPVPDASIQRDDQEDETSERITREVERILAALSEQDQDIIRATVIGGQPEADYAREYGLMPATVRQRCHRAKARFYKGAKESPILKEILGDGGEDSRPDQGVSQ